MSVMMSIQAEFEWRQFPETQRWLERWVQSAIDGLPALSDLERRMRLETGTNLCDWVDHLQLGTNRVGEDELVSLGFDRDFRRGDATWIHEGGLFPSLRIVDGDALQIGLKVESVADFLFAHRLNRSIEGAAGAPLRRAMVAQRDPVTLSVIERHGRVGMDPEPADEPQIAVATECHEMFRLRRRDFETDEQGFDEVAKLAEVACSRLDVDWACSLFFDGEREYWQSRNAAARVQAERQNTLGLGWANHDHHTYRSSREHFRSLIEVLELLGMTCRERFYGGAEAGWGAQVLEQSGSGIVVFADVDLSPQEVTGDFAHEGLEPQETLGTVGLWCKLHGEAMLQAGMHHLECQFEFADARAQLKSEGVDSMAPFTDFDHLKQSFTKGERWQVSEARIATALQNGWIDASQAERFRGEGSIGSHLEILQRWNGYKGFNQTGISDIIRKTDPRGHA